jgi:hypothetical protein
MKQLVDEVNGGGKFGIADEKKESRLGFMRKPVTWWEQNVEFMHIYRSIVFIKRYD